MSTELITEVIGGMGSIPHSQGVAFRVWAPHAEAISVVGVFNSWDKTKHLMTKEEEGYWYLDIPEAKPGDEYRYLLQTPWGELSRIDPYSREVTSSIGNSIVHDPHFDWEDDQQQLHPWNEMVIYEMHVGTFNDEHPEIDHPATFDSIIRRFDHLKKLGITTIQVMPVAEFAGDRSWGYNPAHIFAVEQAYGGPVAFKNFIKAAHKNGFSVILDVVYNHFGPSDLDLWRFDGWSENDGGGIYFYNDWRKTTPWGDTRPDYGRKEVRQFIRDNAIMWLEEYHIDGLRMDMTLFIRSVHADGSSMLPDGWSLLQWINNDVHAMFPGRITIAEDLQNSEWLTKGTEEGGGGFGSQWDARFVHPVRSVAITPADEHRSMIALRDAVLSKYNCDAFQRVVYSESHDEVANGKGRVPFEINAGDSTGWFAQKRSDLAAALVFTSPGIPMIFQGQEFLEGEWFRDTVPVDWHKRDEFRGTVRLYRDLIKLRLNRTGQTRGLCGQHVEVSHVNDDANIIAFRRWDLQGPGDEVMVVVNFHREARVDYKIGFPKAGEWKLLLNSDWEGYSEKFGDHRSTDIVAAEEGYDNLPATGVVSVGPYSVLIYSQLKS